MSPTTYAMPWSWGLWLLSCLFPVPSEIMRRLCCCLPTWCFYSTTMRKHAVCPGKSASWTYLRVWSFLRGPSFAQWDKLESHGARICLEKRTILLWRALTSFAKWNRTTAGFENSHCNFAMHDLVHAVIQGDCFMQKQSSFLEDLNNHSQKATQVNNNLI